MTCAQNTWQKRHFIHSKRLQNVLTTNSAAQSFGGVLADQPQLFSFIQELLAQEQVRCQHQFLSSVDTLPIKRGGAVRATTSWVGQHESAAGPQHTRWRHRFGQLMWCIDIDNSKFKSANLCKGFFWVLVRGDSPGVYRVVLPSGGLLLLHQETHTPVLSPSLYPECCHVLSPSPSAVAHHLSCPQSASAPQGPLALDVAKPGGSEHVLLSGYALVEPWP